MTETSLVYRVVYPQERFITYACEQDISLDLLRHEGELKVRGFVKADAENRACRVARGTEQEAPITIAHTHIEEIPYHNPLVQRWRIYVQVEFHAYVELPAYPDQGKEQNGRCPLPSAY